VNLSSLSFFRSLKTDKRNQQFAVIGLGRFGRAVCGTLHQLGNEVMGIDSDERRVANILTDQIASHAVQIDSTEPSALRQAGVLEFQTVIVAIGALGMTLIIVGGGIDPSAGSSIALTASSETHVKLLKRVGADHVVFPEHEMGCTLARSLTRPNILDRFELDPDHSIVEVVVPAEFDGKTLREIELRSRYGLNLMAVIKGDRYEVNPSPMLRLEKGALMVVIGGNKGIDQLPV